MSQIGRPPQQETAPRAERSLAELLDPVSFEARLVEARARRAAVICRRTAVELAPSDRHPTPSWQTFEKKSGRPANGAGWRILPFLKPDLISPGHALRELLRRFSLRAVAPLLAMPVPCPAAPTRRHSGRMVPWPGFGAGVVIAVATLVTTLPPLWERAPTRPAASAATATQRTTSSPPTTSLETESASLRETAAPARFAPTAMQPAASLAIPATVSPTRDEGSEMPSDAVLGSLAPLRAPTMPADFPQIAFAFPDGGVARSDSPVYLQQPPRIEAPGPEDTASGPGTVAAAPAPLTQPAIAAVSTEVPRPTLRIATAVPESLHPSLIGDPAHSGGLDHELQAPPREQTARRGTAKTAQTISLRSAGPPAGTQAVARYMALAQQVKRAVLESTVEDMVHHRLLRK